MLYDAAATGSANYCAAKELLMRNRRKAARARKEAAAESADAPQAQPQE